MAGCGIVLDALRHGTLVDDRVLPGSPEGLLGAGEGKSAQ